MPSSPKRLGNVAYSMVMFVVVSVLAGVLVAGLFVPFAGLAGVSSKAAAQEMSNLPAELETPAQPERSKVLLGDGKVLAYFYDENRVYVGLDKIAPIMREAQLAIEDHRFYEHGALDFKGTLRAFLRNQAADGVSQGGSSITQQYVKQVQIQACEAKGDAQCVKDAQATTYERKIRELRFAIALEKNLSKDEILERYLNIAYYGDGAYGVEAAAKHYFSTSAAKLDLAQAAMLAGLVQNPDSNNPVKNRSAAIDRRDVVINRMAELNLIDAAQATKAKKVTFDRDKVKGTRNGCVGSRYPFLCDYVFRTLLATESLGKNAEDRENMVKRGGITVETAIDPDSQDKAQKAVSDVVDARAPVISTMDMIQPGSGLIVAMAQSRDVMGSDAKAGETYYNYSVSQAMGGAEGYQAGSTFKAFTAAAALEKGIPLSKRYNAASPMTFSGKTFTNCDGPFTLGGDYRPRNSTGTNGNMDMYTAAARSVNTYFIQLEQTTGMCEVTNMAKKLGVQLADPTLDLVKDYENIPSFTLGVSEVTPLSMAEAYATFASRGIHCNPIIIDTITSRDGKEMAAPSADCKRVISEDVADGMNKLLSRVMTGNGTGTRVRVPGIEAQAGKTGTINNNNAVWYAGYTPELVGVSMIAIDKTRSPWTGDNKRTNGISGYTLPYTGIPLEGSGSGDAGVRIWTPAMTAALEDLDHTSFTDPPSSIENGQRVDMPSVAGLGLSEATKKLQEAGFTVTNREVFSTQLAGTFLGFSQTSGNIQQFGTIYANISNGREDPVAVAERRARERAAEADKKAAEDRAAAADKAAAEKKAADKKAAAEQKAADEKAAADKAAAEKAAAEKAAAEKAAAEKAAAEKKAKEGGG